MTTKEDRSMLTQARLLELLRYDEDTGLFYSRKRQSGVPFGRPRGTTSKGGYIIIKVDGIGYLAHRLAVFYKTGKWPVDEVDHENRSRACNRWANLRDATRKQQRENAGCRKDSLLGCRGVSWFARTGTWRARIHHNKRAISLGYHDTIIDAVAARLSAERSLFTHARTVL